RRRRRPTLIGNRHVSASPSRMDAVKQPAPSECSVSGIIRCRSPRCRRSLWSSSRELGVAGGPCVHRAVPHRGGGGRPQVGCRLARGHARTRQSTGEAIMMAQVPRIDISPFLSEHAGARDTVAAAVAKACEEIGFFKISQHGMALDLVAQAFATASEFFDLPPEVKDRSRPPRSSSARGYHALRTKNLAKTLGYDNPPDLREQFYIGPLNSRSREFAHIPGAAEPY